MSFDPTKWECAGCGRKGSLCIKHVDITRYIKVTGLVNNWVLRGETVREKAKFAGYVCSICDMVVYDTLQQFLDDYGLTNND